MRPASAAGVECGSLFHHHFARTAVGVALDDDAAWLAAEFFPAQVVATHHSGSILFQFQVVNSRFHDHNFVGIPRRFCLIARLGVLIHHIDSLHGRVVKNLVASGGRRRREHDEGGQSAAAFEACITHICDGRGNGDGGQTRAKAEAIGAKVCDGLGNGDGGKTAAVCQTIISPTCDGFGNGDGGHVVAISETGTTQTRDGRGNGDGG